MSLNDPKLNDPKLIEPNEFEDMVLAFIKFKEEFKDNQFFDCFKIAVSSKTKKHRFKHFLKAQGYPDYIDDILIVRTQVKKISY